jgi:phosphonate transport system ATP-binding protein
MTPAGVAAGSGPILDIHQLTKSYGTGELALDHVDISVDLPEVVALLGLSGSGKSTLLRCVNRLVEPTSGTVVLDGNDITRLDKHALRRARTTMGMIFQEFNLVDRLTVLENVLAGALSATSTWRGVFRAFPQDVIAKAVTLSERVGIGAHLLKRADQLSGGQRQRVGIARALMQRPRILLVDEPTSSLDPKIGREVMALLREIALEARVPMIVSLHDLSLAREYSDRIIGLKAGRKIFDQRTAGVAGESLDAIYQAVA